MKQMSKLIPIIVLTLIFSLLCGGCGSKSNSLFFRLIGVQVFAYGELQVTEQWQEIVLAKPVKSGLPFYSIVLDIKNAENWQGFGEKRPKSPQGAEIIVEAQLIAEDGEIYALDSNYGRPGEIDLFVDYERGYGEDKFPKPISGKPTKAVTFSKLRIRSNYAFVCSEIYWTSRF